MDVPQQCSLSVCVMPKRKRKNQPVSQPQLQCQPQLHTEQPKVCSVGVGMFNRDAGLNFNLVVHVFSFLERGFPQWNKLVLTQRDWKERSLDTEWVKLLRGTLNVPTESSPRVVNSGVRWVTKMTALTHLNLAECTSIVDSGVVLLSSLTSLTYLNLKRCCRITCASMQSLSSMTGLTYLNLGGCHIGDAGMQSLSSLTALTDLNLAGCGL